MGNGKDSRASGKDPGDLVDARVEWVEEYVWIESLRILGGHCVEPRSPE